MSHDCLDCATSRDRLAFAERWYAVRLKRLRKLVKEKAPEIEREFCCIIANGTPSAVVGGYEPPKYAQILNQLWHENKRLKAQATEDQP
jgi:hypothetical protein